MNSLKIDGTEIANLIKVDGFRWERIDLDGPNAGRTLDGLAVRDLIASKIRLPDLDCRELTGAERAMLETALFSAEFHVVECDDAIFRGVPRTMYCSSMSSGFSRRKQNGTEYWKGTKFTLVER